MTIYDMGGDNFREMTTKRINEITRENIYIGLPARITNIADYESLQCLDVQPIYDTTYPKYQDIILTANILRKVFVRLPHAGGFSIKLPVAKGDIVTLYYCHKDLGEWLDSDGTGQIVQSILKTANIEDCWVELGGGTRKKHQSPSATDFIIEGPNTEIRITPDGVVTVNTSGTSYLKSASHTIDTDTTITGNLTVNKNVQVDGTTTSTGIVTAESGVLAQSYAGLGGGSATFNVDINITGTVATTGSITINGITLESHTHTDSVGGSTSTPS